MVKLKFVPIMVTVDPGITTAFCLFRPREGRPQILSILTVRGNGRTWEEKAASLAIDLSKEITKYHLIYGINSAYMEKPHPISTAVLARGDQGKLDAAYGIAFSAFSLLGIPVHSLRFQEWKGQLPKRVTVARTKKAMGWDRGVMPYYAPKNEHEWDALGMAVYVTENIQTGGKPHAINRKLKKRQIRKAR